MGKFFDNKFGSYRDNNHELDMLDVEIEIEDPDNIIDQFFQAVAEADTREEVYIILQELFVEGAMFGQKTELINQLETTIETLNNVK